MVDSTDSSANPPPAIVSERVLHYAVLDDAVGYKTGHGLFFVNGKELGKVPCLAICQDKKTSEILLFHCDRDWSSLGVSGHDSVAAAKRRAEVIYPGSSTRWVEANFTEEEADRYLDEVWADFRCSFCGKRPDETLATLFEGKVDARICGKCVAEMYSRLDDSLVSPKKDDDKS